MCIFAQKTGYVAMAQQVEYYLGKENPNKKHPCENFIKRHKIRCAAMAQQVEHVLGKDEVMGSNPVSSSKLQSANHRDLRFVYYVIKK